MRAKKINRYGGYERERVEEGEEEKSE